MARSGVRFQLRKLLFGICHLRLRRSQPLLRLCKRTLVRLKLHQLKLHV